MVDTPNIITKVIDLVTGKKADTSNAIDQPSPPKETPKQGLSAHPEPMDPSRFGPARGKDPHFWVDKTGKGDKAAEQYQEESPEEGRDENINFDPNNSGA